MGPPCDGRGEKTPLAARMSRATSSLESVPGVFVRQRLMAESLSRSRPSRGETYAPLMHMSRNQISKRYNRTCLRGEIPGRNRGGHFMNGDGGRSRGMKVVPFTPDPRVVEFFESMSSRHLRSQPGGAGSIRWPVPRGRRSVAAAQRPGAALRWRVRRDRGIDLGAAPRRMVLCSKQVAEHLSTRLGVIIRRLRAMFCDR